MNQIYNKFVKVLINNIEFNLFIAYSKEEIENGLMFVEYLPENTGMLFIFQDMDTRFMWMKNTIIPLDMIFVDDNGIVVNIFKCAIPLSTDVITSHKKCKYVIEVTCGTINKYNIKVGSRVTF